MNSAAPLSGSPTGWVGTTVANTYVLERLLSQGRHGALFVAKHQRLGHQCVVRLVTVDAARRGPWLSQLGALCQVSHPHLQAPTEVVFLPGDQLLLVSPLLPGQDLAQRRAEGGKLALSEGTLMMRQIAAGLHSLHQRGLVHGNLTANNVFFLRFDDVAVDDALASSKGAQTVRLLDMGLQLLDGASPTATAVDDQRALASLVTAQVADLSPGQQRVLQRAQSASATSRYSSMQELWSAFVGAQAGKSEPAVAVKTALVSQIHLDGKGRKPGLSTGALVATVVGVAVAVGLVGSYLTLGRSPSGTAAQSAPAGTVGAEVTLNFEISPPSAVVTINGKTSASSQAVLVSRGESPLPIVISADGYTPATLRVVPKADRTIQLALAPLAPAPAATDGEGAGATEGTATGHRSKRGGKGGAAPREHHRRSKTAQ